MSQEVAGPGPHGPPPPANGPLPRTEFALALLLFCLGVGFRVWGIDDLGLRVSDEGFHCFWAESVALEVPRAVYRKPLHAVLLSLPFRALVMTDRAELRPWIFMLPQAILGMANLALFYLLARRAWGGTAGLVALAATAAMPYLLFYHRGAFAEGNYLALQTLGLLLLARALPGALGGPPAARPAVWAACSGALFAAACFLAEAATLGVGATALALLPLAFHPAVPRRSLLAVGAAWCAGGVTAAVLLYLGVSAQPWFHEPLYWGFVNDVAMQGFTSRFAVEHLLYYWNYATPPVVLLAAVGAVAAARRRGPLDLLLLGLLLLLLANGFRLDTWAPRRFVATLIPLTLLAGLGGAAVVDFLVRQWAPGGATPDRVRHAAVAALLCLLPAAQLPQAVEFLRLRSAYEPAARLLQEEQEQGRLGLVLAPMAADCVFPFGIRFDESVSPVAALLRQPGGAERAEEWLTAARGRGFTHLLLDYTFRIEFVKSQGANVPPPATWRADPEGWGQTAFPEIRRFLERNRPWRSLEHSAGAYAPTLYENTLVPLPDDPLSSRLLLYRLEEIGRAGAGGGS